MVGEGIEIWAAQRRNNRRTWLHGWIKQNAKNHMPNIHEQERKYVLSAEIPPQNGNLIYKSRVSSANQK